MSFLGYYSSRAFDFIRNLLSIHFPNVLELLDDGRIDKWMD